jgi:hypothetical protein
MGHTSIVNLIEERKKYLIKKLNDTTITQYIEILPEIQIGKTNIP